MRVLEQAAERKPLAPLPVISLGISAGVVALACVASVLLSASPGASWWMIHRWPFVNLAVSMGLIVVLITVARLHTFLALILAAISAGLMSRVGSLSLEPAASHWVAAVELTATEFGVLAGKIGIMIALASVIGVCLLESGAAEKIIRRFLTVFGPKHAGLALLLGTYVVSIPIFFETIFMLLLPLAKALRLRTGKDYVLYVMAICCAAAITHTVVIPQAGPSAVAGILHIDPGLSIIFGLASGVLPLACGWLAAKWINSRMAVTPAELPGEAEEAQSTMALPEKELPSLLNSLLPILLPVLLVWLASATHALGARCPEALRNAAQFLGNRHVALLLGAGIAMGLLMRQRGLSLGQIAERIGRPMETAGMVILIACAGGAFGALLNEAGIGKAIELVAKTHNLNLILLAYGAGLIMRMAQGSVTGAMIAAAPMIYPMLSKDLPYHPVYVFLAIGYGALFVSWMNDGGFWVISRLGGFTEKQTLASWTILTAVISITGLLATIILAALLPMHGSPLPAR